MVNKGKLFCDRLSKLIAWFDPEFKNPMETAEDILYDLKNTIENSKCPTCDERDEDRGDEIVIKTSKKNYPASLWTCPACNVTTTIKNKLNHERTDKHKKI